MDRLPALPAGRLLRSLRREEGVVALETLFSMMILISMTLLFAGVAVALHNQAVLNGATQLAAQESLMRYDSLAYRQTLGGYSNNSTTAQTAALDVAQDVYNESTRSVASLSQNVKVDPVVWIVQCAPNYDGQPGAGPTGSNFTFANCGLGNDQGRVERVFAAGHMSAGLWLMDYINGNSGQYTTIQSSPGADSTAPGASSQQPGTHSGSGLFAVGAAFASGPCSRTGSTTFGTARPQC